jgi:hypothetical protein
MAPFQDSSKSFFGFAFHRPPWIRSFFPLRLSSSEGFTLVSPLRFQGLRERLNQISSQL